MKKLSFEILDHDGMLEARVPEGYYHIFHSYVPKEPGFHPNHNHFSPTKDGKFVIGGYLNRRTLEQMRGFSDLYAALDAANDHYQKFLQSMNDQYRAPGRKEVSDELSGI